jgi:membrane-bound serine protease (ClpP class)
MFEFGWETYALLGLGLLFVVLEVFFPSGGILGFGAALCLIFGGYYCYQNGELTTVITYGVTVVLLAPTTAFIAFAVLPKTPFGKAIILSGPDIAQREATEEGLDSLVGQEGRAITPLRPSGIAMLADRRVDVITRGGHLSPGDPVKVVKVEGNRVIVERGADG